MTEQTVEYDLCVLGCGPGGFAGAMRAFDFGKHVCVVEGGEIGGAGVKWGALASKTMWELSKDYSIAAKQDRGYQSQHLTVDFSEVNATIEEAVKERQYQMLTQLETFSPRRWQGEGSITYVRGWASFVDRHTVEVCLDDGTTQHIHAKNFLISTGSHPRGYGNLQVDQDKIFNSNGIHRLKKFPKRLLILGAGVVGCEYATIFANFGQTQVHLVDHKDRVLSYEDRDVSAFVEQSLEGAGVVLHQSATLQDIHRRQDYLAAVLDFPDGHSEVIEVDAALISVGRQPNLQHLRLDKIGIDISENGFLTTGVDCRVDGNIFACGDVTCHPNLVNIAELEARMAAKEMFCRAIRPLNYCNMSAIMFLNPSVATVGLSEEQCQAKKLSYRVAYVAYAMSSRPLAMRAKRGFVKILVTDDAEMKILGMRSAGPQVSNVVLSIAHFMDHDKGAAEVLKSVYPHPSISETTQECLRLLIGKSIYKAQAFPGKMWVKTWNPQDGYHDCSRDFQVEQCEIPSQKTP
ncbi:NAD(P)/FAD-dependent oxidoreductase [Desulfuromonas acetoxidans]|uniref:FAD-dependent pyridine nucleotide-disulphide oxidoreductase n=1 Tax=Desulfuromonas acetoxidans (strain DSM 684 / 11070) TaxID=281689 RepID=Q1K1S1_DESA6|nr:NAD(P)/FAD-dependent oxidoreductase [Desulfuromonas acetoxidans]EAT16317.1 FAD-dependent pyridine nucleotide-disulphide oxidoreductase [Desulfuromonas acetoxidans DSM 684]MBF0646006.1 NAD(P)/FAD-dependent oxidoreductase [Desulfuromonas acetoxidans]NVD23456.1 NAD(P)/FAD-dependent oxidoreductase [Desulfuromonas acetoxidans]NVE16158.1 NAD(P)/FAD-dependent oxidoreductase [Desulfuromonas acetoxidans]